MKEDTYISKRSVNLGKKSEIVIEKRRYACSKEKQWQHFRQHQYFITSLVRVEYGREQVFSRSQPAWVLEHDVSGANHEMLDWWAQTASATLSLLQ